MDTYVGVCVVRIGKIGGLIDISHIQGNGGTIDQSGKQRKKGRKDRSNKSGQYTNRKDTIKKMTTITGVPSPLSSP